MNPGSVNFWHDTYPSGGCVARRKPECSRATKRRSCGRPQAERRTARRTQRRTTMKEKPNYAELEKRIDFTALAGRLGQLTEQDNPQRKTVFTLLDKVREQILAARRTRNVSYQVLAKELTSAGIPVSEPTLRKYIRRAGRGDQSHGTRPRRKPATATASPPRQRRAPKPNRRRRPGTHRFNLSCDRQSREHLQARSCHAACEARPASRQQRACCVMGEQSPDSVRARVRFALRGDDETKSVRVSSPPDARGLGTDRFLRTATRWTPSGARPAQSRPKSVGEQNARNGVMASCLPLASVWLRCACQGSAPVPRRLHLDNARVAGNCGA